MKRDPLECGIFLCRECFSLILRPPDLHAIHFVINSNERIQREHGPLKLGMALPDFLQAVKSKEAAVEIGQFEEEKRFHADPALFAPTASDVLADFFKGQLFRIEINYRPVGKESSAVEDLKAADHRALWTSPDQFLSRNRFILLG
ncbi:MAG: hypothetical protein MPW15_26225 [Candidatus Manganitrophus sp.]|nr:hypothetical protein [Candidatus Manganitrophus sp.]